MRNERARKWQRRSQQRPAELTTAALRLFAERGFAATRLSDVAAAAGVSKAAVYLYFESKEDLFDAVVRETVLPSLEQASALVDSFQGTTQDLLRTVVAVFEAALDGPFPSIAKLVIAESGNFPELARLWADVVLKRGIALVQKVLTRGVDRGELRPLVPADTAPLVVAPFMLLGIFKQSFAVHVDFQLDRHAVLAAHVDALMNGLAVERGTAPKDGNVRAKKSPRKGRTE
jgi:AcrR family transcriptional regulator